MNRVRMPLLVAVCVLAAAVSQAQINHAVIPGSPLTIHVGADASFQIFNDAVPGVGQVFPTGATIADMGLFARIDGVLFAPNFVEHAGGTATGQLGEYTPWQMVALSQQPTGDGSAGFPYTVGVSLRAPGTNILVNMQVTYVNGNNFFRVRPRFFGTEGVTRTVDAFLGADIFLASSDTGFFISVPELAAVGGHNCNPEDGDYNILMIPVTPAQRFAADHFAEIWRQIGVGNLSNVATLNDFCIDNGAALQWTDIMRSSSAVEVSAAVSFGAVPSASNFHGFSITAEPDLSLISGESEQITVTTRRNVELGFNAPITLSATNVPVGMTVTFDQTEIPAPGSGSVTATVSITQAIFPQVYTIGIVGTGGGETRMGFFNVEVLCTPPVILGVAQPRSQSVASGTSATISAHPVGQGLFTYQWFNNHWPIMRAPVADSNAAELVTGPITQTQHYWARVSNPCGSVDTVTATISPQ